MSNQLGWVQFNRALDAGRASARRDGWGDDERRANPSRRDRPTISGRRRGGLRLGWALTVVVVFAVTMLSWAVTAGATTLP